MPSKLCACFLHQTVFVLFTVYFVESDNCCKICSNIQDNSVPNFNPCIRASAMIMFVVHLFLVRLNESSSVLYSQFGSRYIYSWMVQVQQMWYLIYTMQIVFDIKILIFQCLSSSWRFEINLDKTYCYITILTLYTVFDIFQIPLCESFDVQPIS